ncbi:hypothetical protein M440DRAFT_1401674 [Trichoderma longibrachiatum ATCC 18648]|uniref:Secreted protein n=1 Tax=Trichoderma longibrachiatum ATCC 18648 TaxID=983965 RepID=A0A2T4C3T7_TRILO|nr:hypothetical protein M440DRAFT_1401674 [Trichoderma longibrachiatum ATCC 18648]
MLKRSGWTWVSQWLFQVGWRLDPGLVRCDDGDGDGDERRGECVEMMLVVRDRGWLLQTVFAVNTLQPYGRVRPMQERNFTRQLPLRQVSIQPIHVN